MTKWGHSTAAQPHCNLIPKPRQPITDNPPQANGLLHRIESSSRSPSAAPIDASDHWVANACTRGQDEQEEAGGEAGP